MNTLTQQLKPLAFLLGRDTISKKELIRKANIYAGSNRSLLNLLEMLPFSNAHREGENIILD